MLNFDIPVALANNFFLVLRLATCIVLINQVLFVLKFDIWADLANQFCHFNGLIHFSSWVV